MEKHERHYNIFRLNRLFGISSIVFLLLLVWTFGDDYDRSWKHYQRKFRQLEVAKTAGSLEEELQRLATLEEYQMVKEKLSTSRGNLEAKKDDLKVLEKDLGKLEARKYKVTQEYTVTKSEYDAAKFLYEEAVARGHGDPAAAKRDLDRLEKQLDQRRLAMEEAEMALGEKREVLRSFRKELQEVKDNFSRLNRNVEVLTRTLKKVDPSSMSLANRVANVIRDMPVIDFLAPYYKIDQVVLKDITDDLNFSQVPKVDRCTTCHQGITQPGYENAPQPYTTHPELELYLSDSSPHPLQSFGCTSCHAGRGRGTDFTSAAHTPRSLQQEEAWAEEYEWDEMHYWDSPMYPLQYSEAGCFKCHSGEIYLREADKLNLGTNLIERAGCFGCHTIERYKDKRRIGPDLGKIASKVTVDWTYLWIRNPKLFRHNAWMPRFFGLSNNSDPESAARTDQEIHSIVQYLFKNSSDFPLQRMPEQGDPHRGKELTNSLGCLGCHRIESEPVEKETTLQSLRRDHGPNLIGLASKTSPEWVYNWLKKPERYFPRTKMPNLRLTDEEATDITAYLMSLTPREEFLQQRIPDVDEREIDNIVLSFLLKMYSDLDSRQKLSELSLQAKLGYAGEKLIRFYGCFGCHNIPGFENEKPIGTELTEEGSKSIEKLDFGLLDIERTRQAWFRQKLKHPRSYDKNKVKGPYEKLRMPNFQFTDEEVDAIVTALLGFVKTSSGVKPRKSVNPDVHMGQWLVREYNCQGCHIIENDGGAIRPTITRWLMDVNDMGRSDAEAITPDFSPPNLHTQGSRTQPEWLFDFFKNPRTVRPSLRARMPLFHLSDDEWNSIIKYFQFLENKVNAYESPHPIDAASVEFRAGKKLQEMGACNNCHFYGKKFPLQGPETWGPNLAMVKERLRPDWVREFLLDPQAIVPGTKMPKPYVPSSGDLEGPEAREVFGSEIVALKDHRDAMLQGLVDYLYSIPGKTDITREIRDYFETNGYGFLKAREEEWDEWDDGGE